MSRRWRGAALLALATTACAGDGDATDTTTAPAVTTVSPVTAGAPVTTAPVPSTVTAVSSTPVTTTAAPVATPDPAVDPVVAVEQVATAEAPVGIAVRPGDAGLYVIEQGGRITRDGTPVLDISDLTAHNGEQGLLGLAFHPTEPYAYVNYTDSNGDTVVAEYPLADDALFSADVARPLFTVDQPYRNHNGGDLQFGPDGLLYVGMGDGGSGGDPERRAMDTDTLLGKLLRVDARADPATPAIWAIGLRNPWRFAFDAPTGDLWIADVGQGAHEEIDRVAFADSEGANFGWSAFEGDAPFNVDVEVPDESRLVAPVHTYPHDDGCSVSGGAVYRGAAIPALAGWYVYGDYCSGTLWALDAVGGRNVVLAEGVGPITSVRPGPDAELYVTLHDGDVLTVTAGV